MQICLQQLLLPAAAPCSAPCTHADSTGGGCMLPGCAAAASAAAAHSSNVLATLAAVLVAAAAAAAVSSGDAAHIHAADGWTRSPNCLQTAFEDNQTQAVVRFRARVRADRPPGCSHSDRFKRCTQTGSCCTGPFVAVPCWRPDPMHHARTLRPPTCARYLATSSLRVHSWPPARRRHQ